MTDLIPHLVFLFLAGVRSPTRLILELSALGVDVERLTVEVLQTVLESPEYIKALKKALTDGDDYEQQRVRTNRARYLLEVEKAGRGEDTRTALSANVKLLAYGGMVEVQKHEVDVHQAHEKLLKALAPEETDAD